MGKLFETAILSGTLLFALSIASIAEAQENNPGLRQDSITKADIKRYPPTAVSPEVAASVESILDIRSPGSGVLSPDGEKLYFNWNVTGVTQVWRIDRPKSFPIQMTGGQDRTRVVGISPKNDYIIVSRDRQGQENPGIYLQDTEGGPLTEIYHKDKVQTFALYISDDGRNIYYAANDIRPDSYANYRYDVTTGKKDLLFDRPGRWFISDSRGNGKFLVVNQIGNFAREYYEFDENTKEFTPLLGIGENKDYSARYGAKTGELIVLTPEFGEFSRLYSYIDGNFDPITPDLPQEIESFRIDRQREKIIYSINNKGYGQIKALNARNYRQLRLPLFRDAVQVWVNSIARNGRYMSISVNNGKAPTKRYLYDWRSNRLRELTLPSIPEMNADRFVAPELEYYPAKDGTKIPMFVWRSNSCQDPCPVIVHFHGGPESQSVARFSRLAQLFTENGFHYVEPNVRGSSGYGKTWVNADNGAKRLAVIDDIPDAAKYIRKAWQKDGKEPKIGVMGWSYGGYATLMAMTKFAGSYDAGVSLVGISNLITFLENTAPRRRQVRILEYGDPKRDRQALEKLSPTNYIDRIEDPLLIIQGANDPRVPVTEAIQIQKALENRNISSQLIIFPDEGHGASSRKNQVLEIGNTLGFFEQYLK
ncbi:MAG: S9 family peptidase [Prochloraceae cyanobacterium]